MKNFLEIFIIKRYIKNDTVLVNMGAMRDIDGIAEFETEEKAKDFLDTLLGNHDPYVFEVCKFYRKVFPIILLLSSFLFLSSCTPLRRCPTYGYKKIHINGKTKYMDPIWHKKNSTAKRQ